MGIKGLARNSIRKRAALAYALGGAAAFVSAAPAQAAFPQTPPNDPLFNASPLPNAANEQWDLQSPGGGFDRGISVDRAWPLTTGKGVTIADIDVGVQLDQPDLQGRWAPGAYDFYDRDHDPTSNTANSHGTHVAGVLGARADNGIGIAGIAPGAKILPIRTSDNILHQGYRLAEAIVYATDHGARSLSMSLGADSFPAALRKAVAYAHSRGVIISVASGNEFHFHHHQPQDLDDVLAVGGVNPDTANIRAFNPQLAPVATDFKVHAAYADYGPHLDVVAPTQVPTSEWGGGTIENWSGTSAATPHVAGVAALVISRGRALNLHLSADEVMQIIRMSADDLTDPLQGYAPGWDLISGWGRVNAYAAVLRAALGKVPPVANIKTPDWYAPELGDFSVKGIVSGRSASTWTLELGNGEQPSSWQPLASGVGTAKPATISLANVQTAPLAPGGHTLRLRITDSDGNVGEDRAYFYVQRDPALKPGYPRNIGTSGDASPQLADVNADGRKDIVLATADGLLRVYDGATGREVPGFPTRMLPVQGSAAIAKRIGTLRAGFLSTPAVGDISGDHYPDVVVGGLDGRLYAWDHEGHALKGFPFRIALHGTAKKGDLDSAIFASPALADLDGDGRLDVVFGAADQRIYAVNGDGRLLPGWPFSARDRASGGNVSKILSSPAIGDIDGDHKPDVVEGTGEAYGSTPSTTGRVYALDGRGRLKPGWPVKPDALAADSIPIAGEGVPDSPSLADVDGDGRDEVAVAAFTGEPELYRGDGTRMSGAGGTSHFAYAGTGAGSPASAPALLGVAANSAFGRQTKAGPLRYFGGGIDATLAISQQSPANKIPFEHLLGGWDAATGNWLPAFPRVMEGWMILTGPAIADVDGDPATSEVISGSSGDVLHAFRSDGSEPAGWPKDTGGWLLAAPAVGDVDHDGLNEVVAVTRDGYLWVWDTPARAGPGQWASLRHDRRNTGRYG